MVRAKTFGGRCTSSLYVFFVSIHRTSTTLQDTPFFFFSFLYFSVRTLLYPISLVTFTFTVVVPTDRLFQCNLFSESPRGTAYGH